MGCSNRLLLNQSTHSRVAYSTASKDCHGPTLKVDRVLIRIEVGDSIIADIIKILNKGVITFATS